MEVKNTDNISSNDNEVTPTPPTSGQINKAVIEEQSQGNKNKNILISSLVFIFILLIAGLYLFLKSQTKGSTFVGQNELIKQASQDLTPTTNTTDPTPATKPIYTVEDYVVFAHYNLGYTVKYPVTNVDMHLVGATGGNFTQKYNDGSSILIYDIYPEDNTLSKVTIDNIMQQLTECGEGGCSRFFENRDYEKLQEKKMVNLSGTNTFWIKTIIPEGSTNKLPPHVPIESTTIERYVIPQKNRFLILELKYKDKVSTELSKAISSFRLIPIIPSSWVEYKKNDNSKISFKYPNNYKVSENTQNKLVELKSPNSTITLYYFDTNNGLGKFFMNQTGYPYMDLGSSYKAEQSLGNDVTNLKFSLNAFTYNQGGDQAIRVFDPKLQQVTIYFYANGSPLIYRITSSEDMEIEINQILMAINDLMR